MKEIQFDTIRDKVAQLCIDANCLLGDDVVQAFKDGLDRSRSRRRARTSSTSCSRTSRLRARR